MDRGFVKLWRCSLDSQVWQNPNLWRVWTWCMMRANHKETWITVTTGRGTSEVMLGPGQFLYGRESAAKETRLPKSTVRNCMEKLKNIGNLAMQPDSHYTIVTICNWTIYQNTKESTGQAVGQAKDRQRTGKGHRQECKECREKDITPNSSLKNGIPYTKIVSLLNEKTERSFKPSAGSTRSKIKARFSEGFTEDDFYAVIEKKTTDWSGDPDMEQYLRPETLFGPKFEGYLQSAKAHNSKSNSPDFLKGAI